MIKNQSLVDVAKELLPQLIERSGEIDSTRQLPQDLAETLASKGFYRICTPDQLGGLGQGDAEVTEWAAHWIRNGFTALEAVAQKYEAQFLMTDTPSLVECCLVPQVYNARRFGIDMNDYPKLMAIDAACQKLPAFIAAAPENQADAV